MTKYKEFMRAHGTKMECDYEVLPYNGIDGVMTAVINNGIVACISHESMGYYYAVYDRSGVCNYYDNFDYNAYVGDPCCDPEYIDFLFDTGCNKSFGVFAAMRDMYLDDEKVRIAFNHMRAGIMDYLVFYKWIAKRYQRYTSV